MKLTQFNFYYHLVQSWIVKWFHCLWHKFEFMSVSFCIREEYSAASVINIIYKLWSGWVSPEKSNILRNSVNCHLWFWNFGDQKGFRNRVVQKLCLALHITWTALFFVLSHLFPCFPVFVPFHVYYGLQNICYSI